MNVGVALPILEGHITKRQFLAMWTVEDLEWRKFLAYNIICCYIQYHQPRGYGALEFEEGCLRLYALRYYCIIEYAYKEYYHRHWIVASNKPTFAIMQMETIPNHVVSQD